MTPSVAGAFQLIPKRPSAASQRILGREDRFQQTYEASPPLESRVEWVRYRPPRSTAPHQNPKGGERADPPRKALSDRSITGLEVQRRRLDLCVPRG